MKCRRICRELIWFTRFGELGPSSAPHLDHLAGCQGCRDEVGFDRAMVQQLRIALAARVEGAAPSSGAWESILARTQQPERGIRAFFRTHAAVLAARLRAATAVSAIALAAVIATSTNVGISHPEAGSAETEVRVSRAGERFERQPLLGRPRAEFIDIATASAPVTYVPPSSPRDPEAAFLVDAFALSRLVTSAPAEPPVEETAIETSIEISPSTGGPVPADSSSTVAAGDGGGDALPPVPSGHPF